VKGNCNSWSKPNKLQSQGNPALTEISTTFGRGACRTRGRLIINTIFGGPHPTKKFGTDECYASEIRNVTIECCSTAEDGSPTKQPQKMGPQRNKGGGSDHRSQDDLSNN